MRTDDFDYDLPSSLIAQRPAEPRDAARMLVLDRGQGRLLHRTFSDLPTFLRAGDVLVLNETRVIRARLHARKLPGGGRVELLLLRRIEPQLWEALVGGRGLVAGTALAVEGGPGAVVESVGPGAVRRLRFERPIGPRLRRIGDVPLPPYIREPLRRPDEYQTVFARRPGSAAAPTAGLHFTPELLRRVTDSGVDIARVVLHIGLDTFAPVTVDDPRRHPIHREWCWVPRTAARRVNRARRQGGRIVAVGTTVVRSLETAAQRASPGETVASIREETDLLILPGHRFGAVDGLVTNFHLPRTSLLMLVSAFAGRQRVLDAYQAAKNEGYRFYSFGDAMLIL